MLRALHETARGLHDIGLMDAATMREFDTLCLSSIKKRRRRQRSQALEDLEDLYLAERVVMRIRAGKEQTSSLDEVAARLGLAD